MSKINRKTLIILICVIAIIAAAAVVLFIPVAPSGDKPAMTIACISDPHHEYGVEKTDTHVRPSSVKAIEKIKEITGGGADLVLVGGDIMGRNGEWDKDSIKATFDASCDLFKKASNSGNVMVVTGNHDPEPSVHGEITDINSNDYEGYMKSSLGNFKSSYYTSDLENEFAGPFQELLCYRYDMNGMVFIGLNTPYGDRRDVKQVGYNGLYYEQVEWLQKELETISKDTTVFVMCHYPAESLNTVEVANLKVDTSDLNASRELMQQLIDEYENIIYCYGHVHSEPHEALFKTEELIKPFTEGGAISCHMGSLGYYNDHFGGPLAFEDPTVIQFTIIDIYKDKIVFSRYNSGKSAPNGGEYELTPYTLERETKIKTSLWNKIFG